MGCAGISNKIGPQVVVHEIACRWPMSAFGGLQVLHSPLWTDGAAAGTGEDSEQMFASEAGRAAACRVAFNY